MAKNRLYRTNDIRSLKYKAKIMAIQHNVSRELALDKVAWQEGFPDWDALIDNNKLLIATVKNSCAEVHDRPLTSYEPEPVYEEKHEVKIFVKKRRKYTLPEDVKEA